MRHLVVLLAAALAASAASAVPPFGLGAFEASEPIEIRADKLEASERDGVRTLAFRQHVEVRQGGLSLRAEWLEARYPRGARQPEWLRARGAVRIREGERRAHCEEASYDRAAERIRCLGAPAELWDGADYLAGRVVVFELGERRVRVEGGARVELHSGLQADESADTAEGVEPPATDAPLERLERGGPVTILASALEAQERESGRGIRFQGDVRLRQGELRLRSDTLEAVYPPAGREPERLLAEGDVVIEEGVREARCEMADYRPQGRRVVCEGEARLRDGRDELSGKRIAFDFGAQRVEVSGGGRLRVESEVRP